MSEPGVSYLTLRDLHLESQLSNISKHSIPSKEEQEKPPTNLMNSPVSDINLRDVGIEEQLQKISRNTIKEVWGWKPTAIKSFVTQEMIQEYQDELANKHYTDPLTGKTFKYVPVNTDFELEELDGLKPTLSSAEQDRIFKERLILVEQLKQEHTRLEQIRLAIQRLKDSEFIGTSQYETTFTHLQGRENESLDRIKNIEYEISNISHIISSAARNEIDNKANQYEISKRNRAVLKQKSDELNLLNRGKLNLTQQPNESDEEFKQRIVDAGQVEFDEAYIEEAAGRRATEKFKVHMKEITPNNILVETIVKRVSPERIFLYNKYFSAIKKAFIERYGRHKFSENEAGEIIDVFDSILETVVYKKKPDLIGKIDLLDPSSEHVVDEEAFLNDNEFALEQEHKRQEQLSQPSQATTVIPSIRKKTHTKLTITPTLEDIKRSEALKHGFELQNIERTRKELALQKQLSPIFETRAGLEALTREKPRPVFDEKWVKPTGSRVNYASPWEMSKPKLEELYGDKYRKTIHREPPSSKKKFLEYLYTTGQIEPPLFGSSIKSVQHTTQLHDKKLTRFAPLGAIAINPKALYYENTLILKTHGNGHFSGFNKIRVSDNFVTIIMKMLDGIEPTHHDIRKLELKEKELYDQVIHLAHLHKKVEHNLDQTRQAMKHRFELLHGEIEAGNTNREIKHELMNLVKRMAHSKMISHTDARKYLKDL